MSAYGFSRMFGLIGVKELDGTVIVSGIPADVMARDIKKIWQTNRLQSNMFSQFGNNHFAFPSFYCVEIFYILTDMLTQSQRNTSRAVIKKILKLLLEETWLKTTQVPPEKPLLDFKYLSRMAWVLKPHQREFMDTFSTMVPQMNLNGFLLATPPGCLVGSTSVCFNRGGKGFTLSLEKAYKHFNQLGNTDKRNWDPTTPTYVRSFTGSRIHLNKINGIVYSGIKKICGVTLEDGRRLYCTYDHLILTEKGYIQAKNIVGHMVMCDQKHPVQTLEKHNILKDSYIRVSENHPFAVKKNRIRDGVSYEIAPHRVIYEAHLNKMELSDFLKALHDTEKVKSFQFIDPKIYAVHHIDGNHYNNDPKNLQKMTYDEHLRHHAQEDDSYKNFSQGIPKYIKALSIAPFGSHPTYDICCDAPHHNFVANGIVVHNSGKTFINLAVGVCLGEKAVVKIIISPKNALRLVWYTTISDPEKSAFKTPPSAWYSDQPGEAPVNVEFAVFHFEALDKALILGRKLSTAEVPFAVFVDESHNFNTEEAQRTLALVELCQLPTAHNHVWASGSPIKALAVEAIPLLSSIDPLFTPDVAQRFKKIFGGDAKRANEILQHRLSRVLFKVPKDVIISDRPIIVQHKIRLKDSMKFTIPAVRAEMQTFIGERLKFYQNDMVKHRKLFQQCLDIYEKSLKARPAIQEFNLYKKYVAEISAGYDSRVHGDMVRFCRALEKTKIMPSLPASLRKQFKDSQSVIKYVSLKVQGEALGNILGKRRAECATALALNCNLGDIINEGAAKTLVFASFVSTIKDTAAYLDKTGFNTRSVYAETNSQLNEIIAEFDKDPTVNPLCATFKSLSTAVPLIMASQICMLDRPPRDYMYEQTVARICRMGQTKQTYVHEIILDTGDVGNVSTRADEIINWSREQVASILGADLSEAEITVVTEHLGSWENKKVAEAFGHHHNHVSAWGWALEKLKSLI